MPTKLSTNQPPVLVPTLLCLERKTGFNCWSSCSTTVFSCVFCKNAAIETVSDGPDPFQGCVMLSCWVAADCPGKSHDVSCFRLHGPHGEPFGDRIGHLQAMIQIPTTQFLGPSVAKSANFAQPVRWLPSKRHLLKARSISSNLPLFQVAGPQMAEAPDRQTYVGTDDTWWTMLYSYWYIL